MIEFAFRWATASDYTELGRVMYAAIHSAADSPYTQAQRNAWLNKPPQGDLWNRRLSQQDIIVAETNDRLVGFISLADADYLDFAYILPDCRGMGLFRQLYERLEKRAYERGQDRIWVHASLKAAPAFDAMGYKRLKSESIHRGGEYLDRFEMEKKLLVI